MVAYHINEISSGEWCARQSCVHRSQRIQTTTSTLYSSLIFNIVSIAPTYILLRWRTRWSLRMAYKLYTFMDHHRSSRLPAAILRLLILRTTVYGNQKRMRQGSAPCLCVRLAKNTFTRLGWSVSEMKMCALLIKGAWRVAIHKHTLAATLDLVYATLL